MKDKVELSVEEKDNDHFVDFIESEFPDLLKLLFKNDDMFYDPTANADQEEKSTGINAVPTPATGSHAAFSGGEGGKNDLFDEENESEDEDRKRFSKQNRRR